MRVSYPLQPITFFPSYRSASPTDKDGGDVTGFADNDTGLRASCEADVLAGD